MEDINLSFDTEPAVIIEPEMPESFEEGTKEEISEILTAFRKRAKDEEVQKAKNISTEYWFCAYFASQEQRDAFLSALNLLKELDGQYLPGDVLAKATGVQIPKEEITIPKSFRRPAGIDDMVLDI